MAEPNAEPKPSDSAPKSDLPHVESPSISPAEKKSAERLSPLTDSAPAVFVAPAAKPFFKLRPRHKRAALLAASLTLAAALGSVVGAVTTQHLAASPKPAVDTAALEERKALQQSLAHLSQQVATLKVNLDVATRTARREMDNAHSEVAKLSEKLAAAAADITGSVKPPQTVAVATPSPEPAATPLPQPRPVIAALAPPPVPPRPPVVPDWTLRMARDGVALVEGHGAIYEAVLGAPLPGLGPVQTITREDGRWYVATPRGIIVSARDRRYFE